VQVNWNNTSDLQKICNGIDVVIQAAGMNAQDCAQDPVAALEVNGLGTARLLKAAVDCNVPKFIYLSTAHVYSSPLSGTVTESTCPRNLHPYAASHFAGESVVLNTSQKGTIQCMVLRMSNVLGEPTHQDANCWKLLVNDICKQAAETGEIVLHSSGLQPRDFIGMSDVCRIFEGLCLPSFEFPLIGVVNLGSGVSQSVLGMAKIVQRRCEVVLGFQPKLVSAASVAGERHVSLIYKVEKLLEMGFEVKSDMQEDIDSLLMFCQKTYANNQNQKQ
jgi:UDP-glucose 4-epimerase